MLQIKIDDLRVKWAIDLKCNPVVARFSINYRDDPKRMKPRVVGTVLVPRRILDGIKGPRSKILYIAREQMERDIQEINGDFDHLTAPDQQLLEMRERMKR